jgi:hypothetical protein
MKKKPEFRPDWAGYRQGLKDGRAEALAEIESTYGNLETRRDARDKFEALQTRYDQLLKKHMDLQDRCNTNNKE